jgi:Phytochelatin synthase
MTRGLIWLATLPIAAVLGGLSSVVDPAPGPAPIGLDSPAGQRLLTESRSSQDFVPLSLYFTTQDNLAYCGVASASMVLNALKIDRPPLEHHVGFRLFDQKNLFKQEVARMIDTRVVARDGMTLDQLGQVLSAYPITVRVTHASDTDLAACRDSLNRAIRDPDTYVVVNYDRGAIGQESAGHISPVAAYHEGTDRYLILDVARYRYPPVWVGAQELWAAMRAVDAASGKSRGYVIASAPAGRE